ncbi:glycosyltransferase domain-containing protein [Breznakia pachnodae]|uniref:TOD1/MUCI70 glycosyltransferase-like domain-containing protein n=1 Tax=Breznakia pachnodae TaxID=265178 RepID=A0ABU0DYV5_9FIRM|nr:glycosyltransferase domain-containing protein [Breznakia pachnodae]MDQ0359815.1 hypothetical protein [Breznakia pachnodae]
MSKTIKDVNEEYLLLLDSPEYKLGKYIKLLKNSIKKKQLISNLKMIRRLMKLKKTKGKINRFQNGNNNHKDSNKKIAVYTVLFGNYDQIRNIYVKPNNCDFFIITDQIVPDDSDWTCVKLTNEEKSLIESMSAIEKNRYFKMLGSNNFKNYDYTIYIDANLEIYGNLNSMLQYVDGETGLAMYNHSSRGDIYNEAKACKIQKKGNYEAIYEQVEHYQSEGMPINFGMCECCVIVRDLKNKNSFKLLSSWWNEFLKWRSYRDQIAWPYIVWKDGYSINSIGCLGENIAVDGNFRRYNHGG